MTQEIATEIDRQLDVLVGKGYPALAGLGEGEFRALADPVRVAAADVVPAAPSEQQVTFLLVTTRDVVPAEDAMPLTTLLGSTKPGVVDRNHGDGDLAGYLPIDAVRLPAARLYALVDVERGEEFCDVRPQDALPVVLGRGRTPLTIDEGVALVTQFPQVLQTNRCFMLSGSRRHDKRVPALWIGQGAPKLGWCWDGNPHSWLGTASVGRRLG
ncbi:DUF5701 family protein [Angustibacter luteus]|uniref:DUF5701 family protein n=1 Tax=Angustibacter luteus TaxID=658456 RepID=A0ABW1JAB9_9ACTN